MMSWPIFFIVVWPLICTALLIVFARILYKRTMADYLRYRTETRSAETRQAAE